RDVAAGAQDADVLRQGPDPVAEHLELLALALEAVAALLPDAARMELDDPVDAVVLARRADGLDEPRLLVREEVDAAEEHVRVPEDVGEEDGDLPARPEPELAADLVRRVRARPAVVAPREPPAALVAQPELLVELGVAPGRPLERAHALPGLVRERARVHALRLLRVALEDEPVVLERVHPLDDVQ